MFGVLYFFRTVFIGIQDSAFSIFDSIFVFVLQNEFVNFRIDLYYSSYAVNENGHILLGKWFSTLYTCNYAPNGNFIRGEMYKKGENIFQVHFPHISCYRH